MADITQTGHALKTEHFGIDGSVVSIGLPEELEGQPGQPGQPSTAELRRALLALGPWRKGPFRVFGVELDAHWDAGVRWNRALGVLSDAELNGAVSTVSCPSWAQELAGADVADVGCNNGYYLYRMLGRQVNSAVGLDPVDQFEAQFRFLAGIYATPSISFQKRGYAGLLDFPEAFDAIFLLGILYHHPNPIEILRLCHGSLRTGGVLYLETMVVPEVHGGDLPAVFIPGARYLGAKGVWGVPNRNAVAQWLNRTGFRDVALSEEFGGFADQARTEFADLPLPGDFLDPLRPGFTKEGFPAPARLHAWARR